MLIRRNHATPSRSGKALRAAKMRTLRPGLDRLEARQLLAVTPTDIVPGQLYQEVAFVDSNWDTVEIRMTGPTSGARGFTLRLAGDAVNRADVGTLNLVGLTADNGVTVTVTPNELTINAGTPYYNKMYSSGYTNIAKVTASGGVTAVGGILLSAAIVNDIALPDVAIGGITLDTGMTTYVDRVNTSVYSSFSSSSPSITITSPITGEAEIFDESPVGANGQYNPVAGLIDLYDVEAQSIGSIVINGSISADTNDPFDETRLTNDLRGIVTVSGNIGSIVAPRGAMRNAIHAGGIGSIRLGKIDGEITTSDASQATTIALPQEFTGFLNVAGHLNLGFAASTAEKDTGDIRAGGGISGVDPSEADAIYVPDKLVTSVVNTGTTVGIADLAFNGKVTSRWKSASSIGKITAQIFDAAGLFDAGGDIGDVTMLLPTAAGTGTATRTPVDLAGVFSAGGSIGKIHSPTGVSADLSAGWNIGSITGLSGGLSSTLVIAIGNIGDIAMSTQAQSTTQITAGGNIGAIHVGSGIVGWRVKAGQSIGDILVDAGSLNLAVFAAGINLGHVTVTNTEGTAIEGGSLIAGNDIGDIAVYAFNGTAIHGTLIQAGNRISSVTGISYGSVTAPEVTAGVPSSVADTNNGIDKAQILAAEIGAIMGQAYVGTGLYKIVVHAQVGDIDSITGIGNGDGIKESIVVAEGAIGPITGRSTVLGAGIDGGSFDANGKTSPTLGTIGQVTAQGGPAGGNGISLTRFQASNRIEGIDSTANANGGDAITGISAYASSFGDIKALVLGGQTGNGIADSSLRAWSDYTNDRPDIQIDGIYADVRSALGMGISNLIVQIKGDLTNIQSRALNASAISGSTFTLSQGDIGRIRAESVNSGDAIASSIFTADNGSIGSARILADAGTSGIVAISSGTSVLANGIVGSTFMADSNIGFISATTRGGTAIKDSTFTADSNNGSANNGPNLPPAAPDPDDIGAIFGVYAKTEGQHLVSSAGISGSNFSGETIVGIKVDVTDREEGGAGISGSTFTARNAVYDGNGNFNNMGTIGTITVTDGSLRGNGIEDSQFFAGAAGSIGDINVTTLGGIGITRSSFRASDFDFDQSLYTSTIGNINVTTGRSSTGLLPVQPPPNDGWTLLAAGIDTSYFAADAGIGDVNVNSIGTGIFLSAFLADFDLMRTFGSIPGFILPFFAQNVPGNMGNVNINVTGRYGFGSVFSAYTGANVGNINIAVTSRDTQQTTLAAPDFQATPAGTLVQFASQAAKFSLGSIIGPAASAGSVYLATNGNLGRINVANAGPGFDSILSAYVALPAGLYGPVAPMDSTFANLFWAFPRLFNGQGAATVTANSVSLPAAGSYKAGTTLAFKVKFSGSVAVAGQPSIKVNVGSSTRDALYQSGSGTSELIFSFEVEPGDSGQVTISPGTTIETDLDDRITESATGITLTGLSPAVSSSGTVLVDATSPTVTAISAIRHNGKKYAAGQILTIDVTFSDVVYVQGLPTIQVTIGKNIRTFTYSSGSGTGTLQFTYKLVKADVASAKSAAISGGIVLPSGASIADAAGNAATLSVANPASAARAGGAAKAGSRTAGKRAAARPKASHPGGRWR